MRLTPLIKFGLEFFLYHPSRRQMPAFIEALKRADEERVTCLTFIPDQLVVVLVAHSSRD